MKITNTGEITLTNSDGIRLSAQNSQLYSADGALSYYATDNAVYLNGAGTNGWLRLNASGAENNDNAINIYGGGNVTPSNIIDFRTNGSERMTIGSDGAIKFNSYGSGTHTGTATKFLAVDSSGNVIEEATSTIDGSGTATYLTKFSDSDTITSSAIFQAASGNVSLGVTTPNALFSIGGDLSIGTGSTDVLRLHNESGVGTIDGYSTRNIAFGSATNGEVMRIDNTNGRVGIKNTSPDATLEIGTPTGVAGSAGSVNRFFISPYSNTGGPYKFIARTVSGSSDFLDMYYGSTHIISYALDGDVGVGVTDP